MLYNTNWAKMHNDVFSLESLIAWLEEQNPADFYNFYCAGECMVGQWVLSIDPTARPAGEEGWGADYYLVHGKIVGLGNFVSIANSGEDNGFTFGAALDRARKALAER